MDWPFLGYLIFLTEEGLPGLLMLAASTPILILAGLPKKKLLAGAPGIVSVLAFVVSCYVASLSNAYTYVPLAGLVLTAFLVVPSVLALRNRWLGLLHVFTLLAASYLWFICTLAISGDGT